MATRDDLQAAAAAGLIGPEQVEQLAAFLEKRPPAAPATGEEDLRFIRNFHDVFLAIGILLFAAGLGVAVGVVAAGAETSRLFGLLSAAGCFASVGVLWILAEIFAGKRRLFLPSIALVIAMALFAGFGAVLAAGLSAGASFGVIWLLGALMSVVLFYGRFKLPFALGFAGALAAWAFLAGLIAAFGDRVATLVPAIVLLLGALLFGAGLAFDMRDPERRTRLSDNGFWLHLAAAPLLLQGALGLVLNARSEDAGEAAAGALFGGGWIEAAAIEAAPIQAALTVLAVLMLFAMVSLLINRRALLVSGLLSFGIAVGLIFDEVGLDSAGLAAATLLMIGTFVLALGAGWHGARRAILGRVKPSGVWARVFPAEGPAH
jgi:hypothetical protein